MRDRSKAPKKKMTVAAAMSRSVTGKKSRQASSGSKDSRNLIKTDVAAARVQIQPALQKAGEQIAKHRRRPDHGADFPI